MADEPTKEEIDARARELARRVMAKPYERQDWPKHASATDQKPEAPEKPKREK